MKNTITILFATETGNAEQLARRFYERVQTAGWPAEIHNAAERSATELSSAVVLVIFASTWGSGEPPTDAQSFHDELLGPSMPALQCVSYAVFGLGDTGYGDDFCACARRIDERLEQLGAVRLIPVAQADTDFDPVYAEWERSILARLTTLDTSTR